jgi:hypothetical protein
MTEEEYLQLRAEIAAIQFVLCEIGAWCYASTGWSEAQIKERHAQLVDIARSTLIQGSSNPGDAALLGGALEDSLSDLLTLMRSHLGGYLQRNPRSA